MVQTALAYPVVPENPHVRNGTRCAVPVSAAAAVGCQGVEPELGLSRNCSLHFALHGELAQPCGLNLLNSFI